MVTKSQPNCSGRLKDSGNTDESGDYTEDEAEDEEGLNDKKPRRHQPFPNLSVGMTPHTVTPMEQLIKLEVGEPESVEAHLPRSHSGEWRVGVLP